MTIIAELNTATPSGPPSHIHQGEEEKVSTDMFHGSGFKQHKSANIQAPVELLMIVAKKGELS